jgi:hypothetical protein
MFGGQFASEAGCPFLLVIRYWYNFLRITT